MESPKVDVHAPKDEQQSSERSTISFPYTDLDNAVEVVKGVHNAGGTACDSDQLAAQLKMEAKGGGFRMRVNGGQTFGLVTYERGGRIALTDLGRQLIDPATERQAKMNAFLAVPLYARVFDEFKGGPLPPQAGLERAMVGMGVGAKVKDRARQVMLRSAKQAGFFEQATDRLVRPSVRSELPSPNPDKDLPPSNGRSQSQGGGGGGTGGGSEHPLIQGLLLTLPPTNTPWSAKDRLNWLTMANSIFKMIFPQKADDHADITIAITKESDSK
ncbi:MAG: hypothetical protein ACLPTF_01285 [Steroidobacteraceae bacterium]